MTYFPLSPQTEPHLRVALERVVSSAVNLIRSRIVVNMFTAFGQMSHGSILPSFAHLFRAGDGWSNLRTATPDGDQIAYLQTLRAQDAQEDIDRLSTRRSWQPTVAAFGNARLSHGGRLYNQERATCHNADGTSRTAWRTSFRRPPPTLNQGSQWDVPSHPGDGQRDADVASLTVYLQQIIVHAITTAITTSHGVTQ